MSAALQPRWPRRPRQHRLSAVALVAAIAVGGVTAATAPQRVAAEPGAHDEIVALLVSGTGFGHGRGMSQWGAYGRAVNGGQTWEQILDAYYGGTSGSTVSARSIRVRLQAFDGDQQIGVISEADDLTAAGSAGTIDGRRFRSMQSVRVGTNSFRVYGLSGVASCGAANDGQAWVDLGVHTGPITFSSSVNASTAAPGAVPGVCHDSGQVSHYRGNIGVVDTGSLQRVVNTVGIDDYLRGVVPREIWASWGGDGTASGMHAIRAQAVAARSYALSQARYDYADTCDTTACQAYGGAARRSSAGATAEVREHPNTDLAIRETAGRVRVWPGGAIASTEYSSSNGPRTAGGSYPAIDDPFDDVPGNRLHRWTRIIPADDVAQRYSLGTLTDARTEVDETLIGRGFEGVYANRVVLSGSRSTQIGNWTFRNAYDLPSPGFSISVITRDRVFDETFGLIGDSTGVGITEGSRAPLPAVLDGVFASASNDALSCRRTTGVNCAAPFDDNGVAAAARLPDGTDVAVVVLGYNDNVLSQEQIDQMLEALLARGVSQVGWVNLSERSSTSGSRYAQTNAALDTAASRWRELTILDWRTASAGAEAQRWFNSDGVHLTTTGNAEFARFIRGQLFAMIEGGLGPGKVRPESPLRLSLAESRPAGANGVSLNVTVVDPEQDGYATVWPCDAPAMPTTSNINFVESPPTGNPTVEPNAVMMALGGSAEVCVYVSARAHVLIDLAGWLTEGFEPLLEPQRLIDTRNGIGAERAPLRSGEQIPVDFAEAPAGARSAVLNVTAVEPEAAGFLTVWPCDQPQPNASNVNFAAGSGAEPNLVIASLGDGGSVCVTTDATTEVLVDVMGYLTDGFTPINPERVVDTRHGLGGRSGRIPPADPLVAALPEAAGGATAVAMNVTAVAPSEAGFLTVWSCAGPRPESTSNVNFTRPGNDVAEPNLVVSALDGEPRVCVHAEAPSHVLIDVAGYFTSGFTPVTPGRLIDTRHQPH